jgi:Bacterial capsule synthesis protein PGA_cap
MSPKIPVRRLAAALTMIAALASCSSVSLSSGSLAAQARVSSGPTPSRLQTPGTDGLLPNFEATTIYSGQPPNLAGYDPSRLRVIVATGDLVPARVTNYLIVHSGNFTRPWLGIRPALQSADVTLFNLGDPQLDHCPPTTTGLQFCGDVRNLAPMLASGVNDVVNIANNHIGNYGQAGIDETVQHLNSAGVAVSGFENIAIKNIRGIKFAFVGLDFVSRKPSHSDLAALIAKARSEADVVVAQIHAGKEYETYPQQGLSEDPKILDKLAIDDGADLVIGNFPHCAEGSEIYKGHLISYAQGNFLFDQDWSIGTQESVLGRYYFYDKQLVGVQFTPLRVVGQTTPTSLDPKSGEGRKILDRLIRSSQEIAGQRTPYYPDLSDGNNACT